MSDIKVGDRVFTIDRGTVNAIDEDTAEVCWDVSGCLGDIDIDRLQLVTSPDTARLDRTAFEILPVWAQNRLIALQDERDTIFRKINSPETENWMAGVPLEAAHQVERWGAAHDAGKTAWDWFWLIGYLAQKAATAQASGDLFKAKHHTISTAAALLNWHRQLTGENTAMRPGIDPVARGIEETANG